MSSQPHRLFNDDVKLKEQSSSNKRKTGVFEEGISVKAIQVESRYLPPHNRNKQIKTVIIYFFLITISF